MGKKRINKKVVIRNCIVILLIILVIACMVGKKNDDLKMIEKTKIKSVSDGTEVNEMLVTSGDNQMVVNLGNKYWMFYEFEGDKVSGLKYYYEYENKEEAQKVYNSYKEDSETAFMEREEFEEVKLEGKYIIKIPKASSYATTTKQEVIEMYELLQELYQQ